MRLITAAALIAELMVSLVSIAMDAAAAKLKPIAVAAIKVKNTPSCAAAPKSILLGLEINGPKSVIAPIPKKINGG